MRAVRSGPFRCRVDNVSHFCALGRHDEAEPLARLGRQLGDEQDALTPALWRQVQALVDAHRGQHTQAQQLSGEAVAISERTDALNWQGDALCDLAEVLHAAGQADEALECAGLGYLRTGEEPIVFHDLRHTFGTQCAAKGIDIVKIQAWMGHADIQKTKRYMHYVPQHDDAARLTADFTAETMPPTVPRTAVIGA